VCAFALFSSLLPIGDLIKIDHQVEWLLNVIFLDADPLPPTTSHLRVVDCLLDFKINRILIGTIGAAQRVVQRPQSKTSIGDSVIPQTQEKMLANSSFD
jgi:hypothetical protein